MKIDWGKISIKELASVVSETFAGHNLDAILVGGACVSIYTEQEYLSYDLDFVSYATMKSISIAMSEIGFVQKSSRHFMKENCPFFVEFVAPPVSVGNEVVRKTNNFKTKFGVVRLFTSTDCVKDRLASFYHWNDTQALEQAKMVAKAQKVNMKEIKIWSQKEGHIQKFNLFLEQLRKS